MRDSNPSEAPVLEDRQRLSASMLWRWQRQYFEAQSVEAWRQGIVPHYVTSNTFIAQAYARVVFGYLRDLARDAQPPLLQVLELGAGSGRFSYHFLKKFLPMLQQSSLSGVRLRYVMSDFSERTLAYWQQHPFLQPYIEQGVLDFALVDLSQPQDIVLRLSGEVLAGQPLVVLANYVFDSIEQDAFYIDRGVLHESLVSLHGQQAAPGQPIFEQVEASFHNVPASADYYPEPELNRILADYRDTLAESHVLLPVQAIRYLRHLRQLSGDRLLLLSGDKGVGRAEGLLFNGPPAVTSHGSVSLMVNYHALGQYVEQQGGCMLASPQPHHGLHICAAAFDAGPLPETRQAFTEHICQTSPDDFYLLKRFIQQHADQMQLEQILAYLRISGWDAANFRGCYEAIMQRAADADTGECREIATLARQVWHHYFPLGEESDLAYDLGNLLYAIGYYAEAIVYLQHSRALYGDAAATLHNIGMCHYCLRQMPQALDYVQQALRLDPMYKPARVMLLEIAGEMRSAAA